MLGYYLSQTTPCEWKTKTFLPSFTSSILSTTVLSLRFLGKVASVPLNSGACLCFLPEKEQAIYYLCSLRSLETDSHVLLTR